MTAVAQQEGPDAGLNRIIVSRRDDGKIQAIMGDLGQGPFCTVQQAGTDEVFGTLVIDPERGPTLSLVHKGKLKAAISINSEGRPVLFGYAANGETIFMAVGEEKPQ